MSTTKKKQIKEEKKWYQKTKQDLKKTYRSARGRPGSAGDRELDHAKKLAIKKASTAIQNIIDKRAEASLVAAAAEVDKDIQNSTPDLNLEELAFAALEKEYFKVYNSVMKTIELQSPGALTVGNPGYISTEEIFNIVDNQFAKEYAGATLVKTDNGFQWVFDNTSTTPVNVYDYEVPVYDTMGNDLTGRGKDKMVNPYMESVKHNNQLILENHRKNRKVHPAAKNNWWYDA